MLLFIEVLLIKIVVVESFLLIFILFLFFSFLEVIGVNNIFFFISLNLNLVNCFISMMLFILFIFKQFFKKIIEDFDLEFILLIEDCKIVDIVWIEFFIILFVLIIFIVFILKVLENLLIVFEFENGFLVLKIMDVVEINISGDCFFLVGDVLFDVVMDIFFDNGSVNSFVGMEFLKKYFDDQNFFDMIIEVGEFLVIFNLDILYLDD